MDECLTRHIEHTDSYDMYVPEEYRQLYKRVLRSRRKTAALDRAVKARLRKALSKTKRAAEKKVVVIDVRDVKDIESLLDARTRLYLMWFFDERCRRDPRCRDVNLLMRSDDIGYGLIVDFDDRPGRMRGWRVRGCAFWRDYDLVMWLVDAKPDLLIVSDVAKDTFLRDATIDYAEERGVAVHTTTKKIPGDVMAIFREHRKQDVVEYLKRVVAYLTDSSYA